MPTPGRIGQATPAAATPPPRRGHARVPRGGNRNNPPPVGAHSPLVGRPRPRNSSPPLRDSSSLAPARRNHSRRLQVALQAGTVNGRLAKLTTFRRIRHPSAIKSGSPLISAIGRDSGLDGEEVFRFSWRIQELSMITSHTIPTAPQSRSAAVSFWPTPRSLSTTWQYTHSSVPDSRV